MTKVRNNVGNVDQDSESGTDLLNHMTIFIKRYRWNQMWVNLSDYVYVDQPDHQRKMFNPDPKDYI